MKTSYYKVMLTRILQKEKWSFGSNPLYKLARIASNILEPATHVFLQYIGFLRKKPVEYTQELHPRTNRPLLQFILNSVFGSTVSLVPWNPVSEWWHFWSSWICKKPGSVEVSPYEHFTLLPLRTPALIMAYYFNCNDTSNQLCHLPLSCW